MIKYDVLCVMHFAYITHVGTLEQRQPEVVPHFVDANIPASRDEYSIIFIHGTNIHPQKVYHGPWIVYNHLKREFIFTITFQDRAKIPTFQLPTLPVHDRKKHVVPWDDKTQGNRLHESWQAGLILFFRGHFIIKKRRLPTLCQSMGVSLNGGTPKHPKMIIFSRKTMVVGETHHFRKPADADSFNTLQLGDPQRRYGPFKANYGTFKRLGGRIAWRFLFFLRGGS